MGIYDAQKNGHVFIIGHSYLFSTISLCLLHRHSAIKGLYKRTIISVQYYGGSMDANNIWAQMASRYEKLFMGQDASMFLLNAQK